MLQAPHPVDSRSRPSFGRFEFPLGQAPPLRGEPAHAIVPDTWRDALLLLDARIRALQGWPTTVPESSRLALDWCIACLVDVRFGLYELQACIVECHLPVAPGASAVASYLSEAYVWCGDVHEDVEAFIRRLRSGSRKPDSATTEDCSAYIEEFLEPLFREICESARRNPMTGTPMSALLPLAGHLHVAIVSLGWMLGAA
jgi:hypothetical protein